MTKPNSPAPSVTQMGDAPRSATITNASAHRMMPTTSFTLFFASLTTEEAISADTATRMPANARAT